MGVLKVCVTEVAVVVNEIVPPDVRYKGLPPWLNVNDPTAPEKVKFSMLR